MNSAWIVSTAITAFVHLVLSAVYVLQLMAHRFTPAPKRNRFTLFALRAQTYGMICQTVRIVDQDSVFGLLPLDATTELRHQVTAACFWTIAAVLYSSSLQWYLRIGKRESDIPRWYGIGMGSAALLWHTWTIVRGIIRLRNPGAFDDFGPNDLSFVQAIIYIMSCVLAVSVYWALHFTLRKQVLKIMGRLQKQEAEERDRRSRERSSQEEKPPFDIQVLPQLQQPRAGQIDVRARIKMTAVAPSPTQQPREMDSPNQQQQRQLELIQYPSTSDAASNSNPKPAFIPFSTSSILPSQPDVPNPFTARLADLRSALLRLNALLFAVSALAFICIGLTYPQLDRYIRRLPPIPRNRPDSTYSWVTAAVPIAQEFAFALTLVFIWQPTTPVLSADYRRQNHIKFWRVIWHGISEQRVSHEAQGAADLASPNPAAVAPALMQLIPIALSEPIEEKQVGPGAAVPASAQTSTETGTGSSDEKPVAVHLRGSNDGRYAQLAPDLSAIAAAQRAALPTSSPSALGCGVYHS
jgi:hypothetical protein